MAKNLEIIYGTVETNLGMTLLARSENGVVAVIPGDSEEIIVGSLLSDWPNAVRKDEALIADLNELVRTFDSRDKNTSLVLDLHGTNFQKGVWVALLEIPSGTTLTYTELAKKVGAPNSIRAVATACGANKHAVLIPCHRVVRDTGKLAGYRWGVSRKQKLLEQEGVLNLQLSLFG
jgi:AraC family transcriptional regulator of adaptative response/methylated-DNA-[protein]-cysteine methyltransferase